jgi:predicted SnoaL-like aldol condensation-catalyzing enzyme
MKSIPKRGSIGQRFVPTHHALSHTVDSTLPRFGTDFIPREAGTKFSSRRSFDELSRIRISNPLSFFLCSAQITDARQQSPDPASPGGQIEANNKALARRFYEQLWFSRNPAVVDELVAPTYVVTDIGDRKGVTEPAEEQKKIAEFFWQNGTMTGAIDYQIAEGDLVATRWHWEFQPSTWYMKAFDKGAKALGGRSRIPIINVFRFRDGKIVEVWNHLHDVDTGITSLKFFMQGFLVGLIPMLVISFLLWRNLRKQKNLMRASVANA